MNLRSVPLHVLLADEVADPVHVGSKPIPQGSCIAQVQIEGQPAKPTVSRIEPDAAIPQDLGLHSGRVLYRDGGLID